MRALVQVFVAAFVLAMCGCSQQRAAEQALPAVDPTRINHAQHEMVACNSCHKAARPGADQHKPCDDGKCHEKDFLGKPTPLCQVCHSKVETTDAGLLSELKPYPVEDAWRTEPSRFSHTKHMDSGRMEARVGFHVQCVDCHVRDGAKVPPDHAVCARCHAPEANLLNAPKMTDCAGCHQDGMQERTRQRLIKDDLHFDHDRHKTDRKGKPIKCEQCHTDAAKSTNFADHAAPRVQACVTCHDDTDRTPGEMRMRVCQTCHTQRQTTLTTLAPRSHLPATERPLDHTLAFRRDHAEVAERDASRCATCHVKMSGNPKQACDECHQTMEPSDHRITWRELDHGTEAAADRDRCATCHVVEFCTACHQVRPRSHGLKYDFQTEHGRLARVNLRSCLTCHAERECTECHATMTQRIR